MIPASAVRKFLEDPRDDFRPLKELSHAKIDRMLDSLRPAPVFWEKLGLHQKIGLYIGIKYGRFAFWYDMGTGKTLLSLELLNYWWQTAGLRRALIFVTSDKAFSTWERQVREYGIKIPYVSLDASSSEEKWSMLDHFGDGLVFLTYPGTVAMLSERVVKKKKIKWVLSDKKVRRLLKDVDAVTFDESTKASRTDSLQHKMCRAAAKHAEFCYALAGRPFGRDPTPLWAQMYLVDKGETLGETLGLFREAFFTAKDNYWSDNPHSKVYTFKKQMQPQLSQILQHRSLTYAADECIDLPPERRIPALLRLPADTRDYYNQVVDEVIEARGNMRAMKNAFHRMRQLSSGFLGLRNDETGERAEIEFEQNPKLEWMLDLVESLPEDRKILIFYQYTYSGRLLAQEIKKQLGLKATWLWSGTKNPRDAMARFIEKPDVRIGVIQNQVGAYSLDGLQVANYTAFYESPVSVIDREQAERRTRRQGQKHRTVFYYDPIVKGTMDERILEFHQQGKDLFDALLKDPQRLFLRK